MYISPSDSMGASTPPIQSPLRRFQFIDNHKPFTRDMSAPSECSETVFTECLPDSSIVDGRSLAAGASDRENSAISKADTAQEDHSSTYGGTHESKDPKGDLQGDSTFIFKGNPPENVIMTPIKDQVLNVPAPATDRNKGAKQSCNTSRGVINIGGQVTNVSMRGPVQCGSVRRK
jgi:hypothetical protein